MKPSARKSYGEYKPVIIHPCGRTEIVGQCGYLERVQAQTVFYGGPREIWHAKRGKTFKTREEAIAYAQKDIDWRIAKRAESDAAYKARLAERAQRA